MRSEVGHQSLSCKYIEPSKIGLSVRLHMAVENGLRIIRCCRDKLLKNIDDTSRYINAVEETLPDSLSVAEFIIICEVVDSLKLVKIFRIYQYQQFKLEMRDIIHIDIISSQIPRNYTNCHGIITQQKLTGFAKLPKDVVEYIKLFLLGNVFIDEFSYFNR